METEFKTCKECGKELPLTSFQRSRWGGLFDICRDCVEAKRADKRYNRAQVGGNSAPFSDPDFDGKEPGEVCRMMGRAQRWLESRGYNIILKGTYTQVRTVKF